MQHEEERPEDRAPGEQEAAEDGGWYFDLPGGAWERQQEKNNELRRRIIENVEGHGRNLPLDDERRKRGIFGSGRKKQDGDSPAETRGGTYRFGRGDDEGAGIDGPLEETPPAPGAPPPLRLRRHEASQAPDIDEWSTEPSGSPSLEPATDEEPASRWEVLFGIPAQGQTAAGPEATAGSPGAPEDELAGEESTSRWDRAFGAPADGGLLEGMRSWARREPLETDPEVSPAAASGDESFPPEAPAEFTHGSASEPEGTSRWDSMFSAPADDGGMLEGMRRWAHGGAAEPRPGDFEGQPDVPQLAPDEPSVSPDSGRIPETPAFESASAPVLSFEPSPIGPLPWEEEDSAGAESGLSDGRMADEYHTGEQPLRESRPSVPETPKRPGFLGRLLGRKRDVAPGGTEPGEVVYALGPTGGWIMPGEDESGDIQAGAEASEQPASDWLAPEELLSDWTPPEEEEAGEAAFQVPADTQPEPAFTWEPPAEADQEPEAAFTWEAPVEAETQPEPAYTWEPPVEAEVEPEPAFTWEAPVEAETQPEPAFAREPPVEAEAQPEAAFAWEVPVEADQEPEPAFTWEPPVEAETQPEPAFAWEAPVEAEVEPEPAVAWEPPVEAEVEPEPAFTWEPPVEAEVEPEPAFTWEAPVEAERKPEPAFAWEPPVETETQAGPAFTWEAPVEAEQEPEPAFTWEPPVEAEVEPEPAFAWEAPVEAEVEPEPAVAWEPPVEAERKPEPAFTWVPPVEAEAQPEPAFTWEAPVEAETQPEPAFAWEPPVETETQTAFAWAPADEVSAVSEVDTGAAQSPARSTAGIDSNDAEGSGWDPEPVQAWPTVSRPVADEEGSASPGEEEPAAGDDPWASFFPDRESGQEAAPASGMSEPAASTLEWQDEAAGQDAELAGEAAESGLDESDDESGWGALVPSFDAAQPDPGGDEGTAVPQVTQTIEQGDVARWLDTALDSGTALEPDAADSWRAQEKPEGPPSPSFVHQAPLTAGDWQVGDEDDVVLRAFEAHASTEVGDEAAYDAFEAPAERSVTFTDLLGRDGDDLVAEATEPEAEMRPFSRLQGWAPQRSVTAEGAAGGVPDIDPGIADAADAGLPSFPLESSSEPVAASRHHRSRARTVVREAVETLLLAVLVFLAVRASFQNFKVDGQSMYPTLDDGQFLIVNKLVYAEVDVEKLGKFIPFIEPGDDPKRNVFHGPERGDIVVLKDPRDPSQDLIKRIIALPGETVEIQDGKVYINDHYLEEPYIKSAWHDNKSKILIGEDEYFVMGDNRTNSLDSRSTQIGLVHKDLIIGKAMLSYWPTGSFGLAPNEGGKLASDVSTQDGRPVLTAKSIGE
ncbi:MAG: signal peptidase I [Dehalococcoidia bacterium]|nr:signal peptidase I [Dehalococcoidia bacterium]